MIEKLNPDLSLLLRMKYGQRKLALILSRISHFEPKHWEICYATIIVDNFSKKEMRSISHLLVEYKVDFSKEYWHDYSQYPY